MTNTTNRIARFWRELARGLATLNRLQWQAPWNTRAQRSY